MTRSTGHNTGLAKVAFQYSADTFVVNQTFVLRINICGENRHLRQARNRYQQPYDDSANLNKQVKMDDRKISDKPFGYPSQKQKRSNATHKPTQVASHLLLPNAPENRLQSLHLTNTFYD